MPKRWNLAARVVLWDADGRMLLIRRSKKCRSFSGFWEWPGGAVDPGENYADAAVREAREETGLEVDVTGYAGAFYFEMAAAHVVSICMEASIIGGQFKISDEHDDFAWVAPADLHSYPLVECSGQAIDAYLKSLEKRAAVKS